MKNNALGAIAAMLLLSPVLSVASAADDAAFNRIAEHYRAPQLTATRWVNALLPAATGEAVAGTSADEQFMRAIAYYTRDMLDRAGWVNPYAPDNHYASGNYLLAVKVGEGVTLHALV